MSQGAFGDLSLTSLPKMGIGDYATMVEDDVLRSSTVRDGKLIMLPVVRTYDEVEREVALAVFLRRLEPHKAKIAAMLKGNKG